MSDLFTTTLTPRALDQSSQKESRMTPVAKHGRIVPNTHTRSCTLIQNVFCSFRSVEIFLLGQVRTLFISQYDGSLLSSRKDYGITAIVPFTEPYHLGRIRPWKKQTNWMCVGLPPLALYRRFTFPFLISPLFHLPLNTLYI